MKTTLTMLISKEKIRQYWINSRKKLNKSFNRAAKGVDTPRKKWRSKWLSECCGVGKMNPRWREYDSYPRCGQANETVEHVMNRGKGNMESFHRRTSNLDAKAQFRT